MIKIFVKNIIWNSEVAYFFKSFNLEMEHWGFIESDFKYWQGFIYFSLFYLYVKHCKSIQFYI